MKLRILLPLLFLMALSAARADRLWLQNGRNLEGEVVRLADGRIELRTAFGSFRFPPEQVLRIERGVSFEQQVLEAVAALDPLDAGGRLVWARRCGERGLFSLRRQLLRQVVAIDPEHREARALLGYQLVDGRWLTEAEVRALRGEIEFRGEWMPPEDRARILEQEARAEAAERQLRELEQAILELQLASLERSAREREAWEDEEEVVGPLYPYGPWWGYHPVRPVPPETPRLPDTETFSKRYPTPRPVPRAGSFRRP